jgi:predicted DNA-binding protein YlxM (UPF0122 family)
LTLTATALERLGRVRLLDVYRATLTERQQEALRLHLEEDWSVSELAQALGTSRAAAHDLLRRGLQRMESMEAQLGVCRRLERADRERARLEELVHQLELELRAGRAAGVPG